MPEVNQTALRKSEGHLVFVSILISFALVMKELILFSVLLTVLLS